MKLLWGESLRRYDEDLALRIRARHYRRTHLQRMHLAHLSGAIDVEMVHSAIVEVLDRVLDYERIVIGREND